MAPGSGCLPASVTVPSMTAAYAGTAMSTASTAQRLTRQEFGRPIDPIGSALAAPFAGYQHGPVRLSAFKIPLKAGPYTFAGGGRIDQRALVPRPDDGFKPSGMA